MLSAKDPNVILRYRPMDRISKTPTLKIEFRLFIFSEVVIRRTVRYIMINLAIRRTMPDVDHVIALLTLYRAIIGAFCKV